MSNNAVLMCCSRQEEERRRQNAEMMEARRRDEIIRRQLPHQQLKMSAEDPFSGSLVCANSSCSHVTQNYMLFLLHVSTALCFKNWTPKRGWHNFIKKAPL